jgi:flavorubredoxin
MVKPKGFNVYMVSFETDGDIEEIRFIIRSHSTDIVYTVTKALELASRLVILPEKVYVNNIHACLMRE